MDTVTLSYNELIQALEAALAAPETADGITTVDLVEATGWSERRVTRALWALKRAGKLGTREVYREALNGRLIRRPAYYLIPETQTPAE